MFTNSNQGPRVCTEVIAVNAKCRIISFRRSRIRLTAAHFYLNSSDFNYSNMSVKRGNKDVVINDYGYKLIDLCNA